MMEFIDAIAAALRGGGNFELAGAAGRGLTWAEILAAGLVLLGTMMLNIVASLVLTRIQRGAVKLQPGQDPEAMAGRLRKPLTTLIWIGGVYLAAAYLVTRSTAEPVWGRVLQRTGAVAGIACLFWLFYRLTHVVERLLSARAGRSNSKVDDILVPLIGKSLRVIVPVLAVILTLPLVALPVSVSTVLSKISSILIVGAVAYVLFQSVAASEKYVLTQYDIRSTDNLQARKIVTQVHVLGKTLYVVIALFTAASILMLFDEVRRLGTSILASAGVVGIIIGFAAQRTIANLFAGFQLAMTQPIRMDDVVIVEGEWGRIEEITLTYVVVRIWDERRLIVPLSYFIEKPFQNWTRMSADLLGSVFLYVDYSLPLGAIREEVQRIVHASPLWDRKFWNLQVTDVTERTMQIRILATAPDSGKAWDLRCEIREKVLRFVQEQFPSGLPTVRAAVADPASFQGFGPSRRGDDHENDFPNGAARG